MSTVSIDIGAFEEKVSSLRSVVTSIESSIKTDVSFDKTNIKPFTKDVEVTIEAIELLERYKQMLLADTDALEHVGKEMKEKDEQLASVSGPQLMK